MCVSTFCLNLEGHSTYSLEEPRHTSLDSLLRMTREFLLFAYACAFHAACCLCERSIACVVIILVGGAGQAAFRRAVRRGHCGGGGVPERRAGGEATCYFYMRTRLQTFFCWSQTALYRSCKKGVSNFMFTSARML